MTAQQQYHMQWCLSVSESSNIILFNALNRLDSIEQVLGKTKMPPYLTKFDITLGDPSHSLPVCKQAQLCHPLVSCTTNRLLTSFIPVGGSGQKL